MKCLNVRLTYRSACRMSGRLFATNSSHGVVLNIGIDAQHVRGRVSVDERLSHGRRVVVILRATEIVLTRRHTDLWQGVHQLALNQVDVLSETILALAVLKLNS